MKTFQILFVILVATLFFSCEKEEVFPSPEMGTVTDIQGNVYATVKIGNQWWMAENLRSTQYDTESERKPVLPATEIIIPTSNRPTAYFYGPSYVDVRNTETLYSGNLTAEQRTKLGFLYTWAAAVGESSASAAQNRTANYTSSRQGICPNGWHVPTDEEWTILIDYLGGLKVAGEKMKTQTGWYKDKNYKAGTNSSGFSVLPSGIDFGTSLGMDKIPATFGIGFDANFWSSNADSWFRGFRCSSDEVNRFVYAKFNYMSVRCVKNSQ